MEFLQWLHENKMSAEKKIQIKKQITETQNLFRNKKIKNKITPQITIWKPNCPSISIKKKSEFNSRPEAENLINIYCSLSDKNLDEVLNQFGGKNFQF